MSHWDTAVTAGSLPPSVPTTFTENTGTATPAANNLNVLGANGITTVGSGSTVTISIQNGTIGQAQTVNAATADIITVDLVVAGTYTFEARSSGYDLTGVNGVGFSSVATFISNGVTATLIDDTDGFSHTSTPLDDTAVNYLASGRNAVLRVLGQAGFTINWGAFGAYVFRGAV